MNTARILKNIKAFNSDCIAKTAKINKLKSTVLKEIKEDKKKKTKSALKRIEKNKEWIFVYDLLLVLNERNALKS